jgi:hypothetical protein
MRDNPAGQEPGQGLAIGRRFAPDQPGGCAVDRAER